MLRVAILLLVSVLAACRTSPPEEISEQTVWLPEDARAGMYVTWQHTWTLDKTQEAEQTLACVARDRDSVTIEWRFKPSWGPAETTAVRFTPAGQCIAAWRGSPGGVARPMRIVEATEREGAAGERILAALAISTEQCPSDQSTADVVQTPKGTIPCIRHRASATYVGVSHTTTIWRAQCALPMTDLVRAVDECAFFRHEVVVAAYGTDDAGATLKIP